MSKPTEEELVNEIKLYLESCQGKPVIKQFLNKKYGNKKQKIKFESFGFGKYGSFMSRHNNVFGPLLVAARQDQKISNTIVTEQDLINIIKSSHIKQAQNNIRKVYGNGPFSQFGYGTFQEFIATHNLISDN